MKLGDGTKVAEGHHRRARSSWSRCATTPTVTRVRVLSPLTDDSEMGVAALAYGLSLATGKLIERR